MGAHRKKKPAVTAPATEPRATTRREQFVAETIEEAMRPYLGVLPKEGLATMRRILEEAMATHPVAVEALDAMEAEAAIEGSHTRVRDDGGEGGGPGSVA